MNDIISKGQSSDNSTLEKVSRLSSNFKSSIYCWLDERLSEASSSMNRKDLLTELSAITYACLLAGFSIEEMKEIIEESGITLSKTFSTSLDATYKRTRRAKEKLHSLDDVITTYRNKGGAKDPKDEPRHSSFYAEEHLSKLIGPEVSEKVKKCNGIYYFFSEKELIWKPSRDKDDFERAIMSELSVVYNKIKDLVCLPPAVSKERASLIKDKKSLSLMKRLESFVEIDKIPVSEVPIIAVQEKIVDISTGKTRELIKEDFVFQKIKNTAYNKDSLGKSKAFASLLSMFDESELDYLQRFYGTSILDKGIPQTLFLSSTGGQGRTVFNMFIKEVLEDYSAYLKGDAFMGGSAAEREHVKLENARFVFIDELENLDLKTFKVLTGGTSTIIRNLFQESREVRSVNTYVCASNKLPVIEHRDGAIERRAVRVTVKPRANGFNPNPYFFENLINDTVAREDLLAWLVEGAIKYLSDPTYIRNNMPESIKEATDEWLDNKGFEALVNKYIEETGDLKDVILTEDLLRCMTDNNSFTGTRTAFIKELSSLIEGLSKDNSNVKYCKASSSRITKSDSVDTYKAIYSSEDLVGTTKSHMRGFRFKP